VGSIPTPGTRLGVVGWQDAGDVKEGTSEMSKADDAFAAYQPAIGQSEGSGDWIQVTQQQVNDFAEVTDDHQFIHVDPEAAAERSPWGTTIAHGFLTLSLLVSLARSIPKKPEQEDGAVMGINYGFDKIRFINPVKVGSRIRCSSMLASVVQKDSNVLQVVRTMTVEIEGEAKPALVADWITQVVFE
jgi:acyl dehydratase